MYDLLSKNAQIAVVAGHRHLARRRHLREHAVATSVGGHSMSFITYLVDGLFGLVAVSSLAGFVFHLLTGNPDMALMCFVGIGGSAATGWMFAACRRA
jgi:hypothetical protein